MQGNKAAKSRAGRWFKGWRGARQPTQPDFADLGTAFGLDLSLHQMQLDEMLPAPPLPLPPAAQGWVRRLTARRRSAG